MKKYKFPKTECNCILCAGKGYYDISYHGSPQYEDCERCQGKEKIIYHREMNTEEKLNYLLQLINKGQ